MAVSILGSAASPVAAREIIPGWNTEVDPLPEHLDPELLVRAYQFSEQAHRGQKRHSGEDYVSHCVEVAKILAGLRLDTTTIVGGLVHDVIEDTPVTIPDIEREFGKEVAAIVDGLTKIEHLQMHSSQDRQVENYRKLLLSIEKGAPDWAFLPIESVPTLPAVLWRLQNIAGLTDAQRADNAAKLQAVFDKADKGEA